VIIETLREEGYHVSDQPTVFSPHLLPPWMGGAPQVRERVFITATLAPDMVGRDVEFGGPAPVASMADRFPRTPDWPEAFEPKVHWHLEDVLDDSHNIPGCELSTAEFHWINAWDEFVRMMRPRMGDRHLPGHPVWAEAWLDFPEMGRIRWEAKSVRVPNRVTKPTVDATLPGWKQSHLAKNYDMFARHFEAIIPWAHEWGVYTAKFPPSRRKLEWQAQETKSLWETVMHLRPSGIRAKKPTYLPALVAITQTSIIGSRERRLSPRETARLQGLPDTFAFPNQPAAATYKQMGNGVNVGAVWHIFREHVRRDRVLLQRTPSGQSIVKAIDGAPPRANEVLAGHRPAVMF
jgi:DNA (cytosine-5)-methyltransferase 1